MAIAFLLVNAANSRIASTTVSEELQLGVGVVERLLDQNRARLEQAAGLLSSDFGFREAIATRDLPTIDSALRNHGSRIGADAMMLVSLDRVLLADTLHPRGTRQVFGLPAMLNTAERDGHASSLALLDGKLYQIVIVGVLAPDPIGWVAMGFSAGDRMAEDLRKLSGLEVSFVEASGKKGARILASTLHEPARGALPSALGALDVIAAGHTMRLAGDDYQTRVVKLSSAKEETIVAVLQRSLTRALGPFNELRDTLELLAIVSLLACILGSLFLARKITQPINALADAAQRIQEGDYSVRADVHRDDEIGQLAASFNHMGESIAEREQEILRLAYEDSLTGLPNRAMFNDRLREAVKLGKRTQKAFSVMMMDLDRFKYINDSLGHHVGDQLLIEVGKRLRMLLRESDSLARLGGDEFVMLLPTGYPHDVGVLAKRIIAALEEPIVLEGQPLDVSTSIGIAHFPEHATDAVSLLQHADLAMYVAKRNKVGFAVYEPQFEVPRQDQLSLLGELRRAVEQNELTLYYQAKIAVSTGTVVGVEALVRWFHPTRGFMPPNDFIPFAEQTGYVKTVTAWVLARAIEQCARWQSQGRALRVSVNISARDLLNPELPRELQQLLQRHKVDPKLLCLEITESALMEDPRHAKENVSRLREVGVQLSIDDYGTGYSSLAYIRNLNVDELKIDQTFVQGMTTDRRNVAIVRSAIDLAHNLGLKVAAEGVEEQGEMNMLRSWGCDEAQGYLINKPLPADEIEKLLSATPSTLEANAR